MLIKNIIEISIENKVEQPTDEFPKAGVFQKTDDKTVFGRVLAMFWNIFEKVLGCIWGDFVNHPE